MQDPIYHHNFHETQRAHLNQQGHTNYLSQFSGFNGGKQQGYEGKLSGQFFPTAQQDSSLSNVTEKHFTISSKKSKVENRWSSFLEQTRSILILRKLATKEEETIPFWRLVDGRLVIKVTCIIFIKQFLTHGVFISISRSYLYLPSFRTQELYYTRILFVDFCSKPVSPRSSTTPMSVTHSNI